MATTARSLSLSDLPAEVTDVVRTFHPSTLWGRWEKVTHRSHVREDGPLEGVEVHELLVVAPPRGGGEHGPHEEGDVGLRGAGTQYLYDTHPQVSKV